VVIFRYHLHEYCGSRKPRIWPGGSVALTTRHLALTSPTSGARLVTIVRLRTKATESSITCINIKDVLVLPTGYTFMFHMILRRNKYFFASSGHAVV
jgi:hypothetical protein